MRKIIFNLSKGDIRNINEIIWPNSRYYPAWFRIATIKQHIKDLIEKYLQSSSKSYSNSKK